MHRVLATTVLALSASLLSAAAGADETGTWQYQCLGDEAAGAQICTTEFATFEDGQEFVLYFVRNEKGPSPLVVSGEDETISAASVTVDKNDPVAADSCEDSACYFSAENSDLLLKQFRKGHIAQVTIRGEGQQVIFDRPVTLRGFSAAFSQTGS
jgi:Invasion associated locus B (IalB) protein